MTDLHRLIARAKRLVSAGDLDQAEMTINEIEAVLATLPPGSGATEMAATAFEGSDLVFIP